MIRQVQFSLNQRPAWQRYLIFIATIIVTATLFWIGLIFVFGFAVLALLVAVVNRIKFKLTGRPLFKGPQHFHRYQSQFKKDNVIEGEVIPKNDDIENR
jgi:UDP-N-acetylmuramyl pentapeptide phosphotransferase/UDP-N-acetylglucosamine-1-phosphate transferase